MSLRNPPIFKACPQCGATFKAFVSQNRKFCSYECKYAGADTTNLHNRGIYLDHEVFWSKVQKTNGCWEWQGHRSAKNYGHIGVMNKLVLAHRYAWTIEKGEIPEGMCILHHCDNPPCVRIDHLYVGTRLDNARDRSRRGRNGDVWSNRVKKYRKHEQPA